MKLASKNVLYSASILPVVAAHLIVEAYCDAKPIVPVHHPKRIKFANESKPFTVHVTKYVCTETPYNESELLQCKTILRRNKPALFNISVHVPIVLNTFFFEVKTYYRLNDYQQFPAEIHTEVCSYFRHPSEDILSRHIMSVMFETVPHLMYYCPHGNTTYHAAFWIEDRFFPKSMPAGDFRMDVRFRTVRNITILAYRIYFSVRRQGIWKSLIEW
uniref:Uncharacterized protein n=1 Tax=Anopheles farauti TaxID=69004 RepID=A0A182QPM9_9DIPT